MSHHRTLPRRFHLEEDEDDGSQDVAPHINNMEPKIGKIASATRNKEKVKSWVERLQPGAIIIMILGPLVAAAVIIIIILVSYRSFIILVDSIEWLISTSSIPSCARNKKNISDEDPPHRTVVFIILPPDHLWYLFRAYFCLIEWKDELSFRNLHY